VVPPKKHLMQLLSTSHFSGHSPMPSRLSLVLDQG
jgi:hypothetical protein